MLQTFGPNPVIFADTRMSVAKVIGSDISLFIAQPISVAHLLSQCLRKMENDSDYVPLRASWYVPLRPLFRPVRCTLATDSH